MPGTLGGLCRPITPPGGGGGFAGGSIAECGGTDPGGQDGSHRRYPFGRTIAALPAGPREMGAGDIHRRRCRNNVAVARRCATAPPVCRAMKDYGSFQPKKSTTTLEFSSKFYLFSDSTVFCAHEEPGCREQAHPPKILLVKFLPQERRQDKDGCRAVSFSAWG